MRVAGAIFASMVTILAAAGTAYAQDPGLTERERMLLDKVQQLEQRIDDIEKSQAAASAVGAVTREQAQAELEGRVAQIEEQIAEDQNAGSKDFKAFWKDGLRFETEDGRFRLQVGGRIMYDVAWYHQDEDLKIAVGDEQDGGEFRRARIFLSGTIYDDIYYKAQYDFAGDDGNAKFKDVYVGLQNIPYVGKLQLGHYKEPFGLEQLTSSKYTTFMERSLADAFTPGRNMGVMVANHTPNKRLAWALGLFQDCDDFPGDNDGDEDEGWAATARISGVPWYADEGRKLLHLGAAYSHRNPDGASPGWRERPESHLA
ncbi:MAG: hypothetical protein JXR94_14165, partial [Candidatus Hydrogenedentes bacterium]|nr:hypothetical protein [Candidatus Hydrogenedentota bacterium]